MKRLRFLRVALGLSVFVLASLVLVSVFAAAAAANTVPDSRLDQISLNMLANQLKPAACNSINLTTIIICTGSGTCRGTGANNLILGTPGDDTIKAGNGTDCIIAGAGDDSVTGNSGVDICIEGPGFDTYKSCTVY